MSEFKSMKDLQNKVMSDIEKTIRGSSITIFNEVIINSPIDTGRFRGNWNASISNPDYSVKGDSKSYPIPKVNIGEFRIQDTLYLTNNLPYAARLAHGWSQQRPDGWIDQILLAGGNKLGTMLKGLIG